MEGHSHDHGGVVSAAGHHRGRLAVAFALIAGFCVVEAATAVLTGSLALLSDAGHMLADAVGLGVALAAVTAANRPRRRPSQTFGLYRLEILAALGNAALLLGLVAYVAVETVRRLSDPPEVLAVPMLVVATLGLVVNLVGLVLLRGGARDSITMEGAALELFADTLGSVGAILAAVVLLTTGWLYADVLVAGAIAVMIVPRALRLGRRALSVLVQNAPPHLQPDAIQADLAALDAVVDVHDLHLWTLTSGMDVASAHLMVLAGADPHPVLDAASALLRDRYGVDHATLQVEPEDHTGCAEVRW
ncbi:cation diffusion facilitator family transporter [soil metagenome]